MTQFGVHAVATTTLVIATTTPMNLLHVPAMAVQPTTPIAI